MYKRAGMTIKVGGKRSSWASFGPKTSTPLEWRQYEKYKKLSKVFGANCLA